MMRLWLLSRLSSNRSTRFKRSSMQHHLAHRRTERISVIQSRFFVKEFSGLGLLFSRVSKGVSKFRSIRLCALEFVSCKRSSFRSKQAKVEIAATDRSLLGKIKLLMHLIKLAHRHLNQRASHGAHYLGK